MLNLLLEYPNIDPIALELGPLVIRWYSLSYIGGLLLGWWYLSWMNKTTQALSKEQYDSILTWAIFGVVLGGRLGYVLFYKPLHYLNNPEEIFAVWQGGMSYHGGTIGVILAIYIFTRRHKISFFPVMDMAAVATPIGLGLGRLANFINGELYGRATDSPIGMVFPTDPEQISRHPSQLYEAALEGLVLFVILFVAFKVFKAWQRPMLLSAIYLIFYGAFRIIAEFFREPDVHLGFIFNHVTMGQILSIPMILLGIYLVWKSEPQKNNN